MNILLPILFYTVPVFLASLQTIFQYFKVEEDLRRFSVEFDEIEVCDFDIARNTISIIFSLYCFFFVAFLLLALILYCCQEGNDKYKVNSDFLNTIGILLFVVGILRTACAYFTTTLIERPEQDCFLAVKDFEPFLMALTEYSIWKKCGLYTYWFVYFFIFCCLTIRITE